ncbi:HpcH/HpaI aldolase/citrate lyase family protein [candidate division KSB1 bacterium]|nr:HpcH/HpaI aldolase/citrate lyase family protein [candidate division KSB1 bacterium]
MNLTAQAGRRGDTVRSDCWVQIERTDSGGLRVDLHSKVDSLYGRSIRTLVTEELAYFGIENATVVIDDAGALPFVLMARVEAACKRLDNLIMKEYLPELRDCCNSRTERERFRRSRLYLPGNEPKFMVNAGIHKPDGIILDLEDSVSPLEKDAAAFLVRNALRQIDFGGAERMVRINQLPRGLDDLKFIVPHNVHVILIPKCESGDQVKKVASEARRIKAENGMTQDIYFMPILESAKGILNAYSIATSDEDIVALTIGLEDYTADIGVQRTAEGKESIWARSMVVTAARAAGLQPIDTVFSDVSDMAGLRNSVLEAKSLGFDGKGCIHPRQIRVIHEAFAPNEDEITKAKQIVLAFEKAEAEGLGVVSLGSKMIDPPVVKRALRTVNLAVALNLLPENWREGVASNEK